MKIQLFILLLIVFSFAKAQEMISSDSLRIKLTTISQVNQDESYITFPTDIGNIESLWFEANINPNFFLRTNKDSRLIGVLTPQIIIRMYQEESFPIRTPSYIPQITAYYRIIDKTGTNRLNTFLKLAHHSNGQDDDFFLKNGDINTKTGNFSTNYAEVGIIKTNYIKRFNAIQFLSTSFEVHPETFTDEELVGMYGLYRWNTIFSIFKLPEDSYFKQKKASISIKGKTTWIFGDIHDWKFFEKKRFNINLIFFYHPSFFEDIGFFTSFYHGSDYYNIYFNHQLTVLRFGIMTEKLKF